jgi:rhodanese-related sulfurtransferase
LDTARPDSISPQELAVRLAAADAPLLLDVRREPAWQRSAEQLAGALRCPPERVSSWAAGRTPRELVVYCVYGHGVSQGVAQALRAAGWPVRFLAGGFEGGEDGVDAPQDIARWRAVPLPRQAKGAQEAAQ